MKENRRTATLKTPAIASDDGEGVDEEEKENKK